MLIGLGRSYYTQGQYWLIHPDLHVMLNILLLSFNLILLNLLIKNKIFKEYFMCIILSIVALILLNKDYNFYCHELKYSIIPYKTETYKAEKIIKLANLKNKPAYLSKNLFDSAYYWGFFKDFDNRQENIYYDFSPYIKFLNNINYQKEIKIKYLFVEEKESKKEFEKNGGVFTDYELNIADFNKLSDEDFILNKKEMKY